MLSAPTSTFVWGMLSADVLRLFRPQRVARSIRCASSLDYFSAKLKPRLGISLHWSEEEAGKFCLQSRHIGKEPLSDFHNQYCGAISFPPRDDTKLRDWLVIGVSDPDLIRHQFLWSYKNRLKPANYFAIPVTLYPHIGALVMSTKSFDKRVPKFGLIIWHWHSCTWWQQIFFTKSEDFEVS